MARTKQRGLEALQVIGKKWITSTGEVDLKFDKLHKICRSQYMRTKIAYLETTRHRE